MSLDSREGRALDPRAVRVSVPNLEDGPAPIIVEPPVIPAPLGRGGPTGPSGLSPVATLRIADSEDGAPGDGTVLVDGEALAAGLRRSGGGRAVLSTSASGPGIRVLLLPPDASSPGVPRGASRQEVVVDGWRIEVEIEPAARAALRERASRGRASAAHDGPVEVHAIIPGVVVSVSVAEGDQVAAGQQLLVVEAMKMQNELRSPREGTVQRVAVAPGRTIEVGDLLLVIE